MDFHIGSIIRQVANDKRVGPTELGARIETSKQNIYGIFRRQSIDTKLLVKLSIALEHDFFLEYTRFLDIQGSAPYTTAGQGKDDDLQHIQSEIEHLKKENQLLQKMVNLLEMRMKDRRGMEEED